MTDSRSIRILTAALAIMLGYLAVQRAARAYLDFSSPIELSYPNSVMAYLAREYQYDRPIYRDFREPPHVLALYGPLLYAVPGTLGKWLAADEQGLFAIGRSMSLLATVGTALIVVLLVRGGSHTGGGEPARAPWIIAVLAGLMYLTAAIQWPVCLCFRADPAETLLVLSGLAVTSQARSETARFGAIALFLLAFLYKQSAVVAPIAVAISLLLSGRRTSAVRYAFVAAAAFGALILTLNVATGGMYSLNALRALRVNITAANLVTVAAESALGRCLVPYALAAAALVLRGAPRRWGVLEVFFPASFAFATATALRDGSADNYFLQSLAAACVIAGWEWARWSQQAHTDDATMPLDHRGRALPLTALTFAVVFFIPPTARAISELPALAEGLRHRAGRDRSQRAFLHQAAAELDALNGPVLCQYDPVNLYCRNAIMMDTLTFTGLADQGAFDDSRLIELIRTRRLAAAALLFPLESDEVPRYQSTAWVRERWLRALWDAGYRGEKMGPLFIYRPPITQE